jgi:hypothetical protein
MWTELSGRDRTAMKKWIVTSLFSFHISMACAQDHGANFYVAATGRDTNNCRSRPRSCATLQRAAELCRVGQWCDVHIAPGVYDQSVSVVYHRIVNFIGDCSNRGRVVRDGGIKRAVFAFQDYAIGTVSCLTIGGLASGSTGVLTRQFAIADVNNVQFGPMPDGTHIAASENSRVNVYNATVAGNANYFVSAVSLSLVNIGGSLSVQDGLIFVSFVGAYWKSIITAHAVITGGVGQSGLQYAVVDSVLLISPNKLPGHGTNVENGLVR